MNIAICDDEALQLKLLSNYCLNWCKNEEIKCNISTFSSGEAFLFSYEDNPTFDIILLDIQMKELNGMDLAKTLRKAKDPAALIFITGLKDYVFEGYQVQAIDYLLKPIEENRLYEALGSAYSYLSKASKDNFLLLQQNNQVIKLPVASIILMESQGHNTKIYTEAAVYLSNEGISSYERKLSKSSFFKCHRCYLINIAKITAITKTEVHLEESHIIPIARGKWEELNKAFLSFYRSSLC